MCKMLAFNILFKFDIYVKYKTDFCKYAVIFSFTFILWHLLLTQLLHFYLNTLKGLLLS